MPMIKRDEIKEANYLKKMAEDVPEFLLLEEFDDLIFVDYDRLGTYLLKLLESSDDKDLLIAKKIFKHLNLFFETRDELALNILEVCIFEALITIRYGYLVAEKFMDKEMYKYFIEKFPYEKYKDSWDSSNYYSEEEYQRILNLPDVDDEE